MSDYRSMYDRDYIYAFDLNGRDHVVIIARVQAGELTAAGGRKSKKPIIFFEGKEKGFALNKTNGKTIAAMYGNDTTEWLGKRIVIFPTTTSMGGETVDCIRVRPRPPADDRGQARRPTRAQPPTTEQAQAPASDEERAAAIDRGEA